MIIDLKRIFANDDASLPVDCSLDMSSVEFAGVFPLKKPVKLIGSVFSRASIVRLSAKLSYTYEAPCDRCGTDAARDCILNIEKSLAASLEGEESDDIILIPDMKLDLDELIYTEVVVSLPMKHLCREDCKGICAKCGKNLNEGKCGCPEKEIDPRLSALADLLNN